MAESGAEADQAAIDKMARDWLSEVGKATAAATERCEDYMRFMAPISPKGSKGAPIGFLKARIVSAEPVHYGDDGIIMGMAGTRTKKYGGAANFPLPFISNDAGSTWNRGRKSKRPAHNRFIQEAISSLDSFYWHSAD